MDNEDPYIIIISVFSARYVKLSQRDLLLMLVVANTIGPLEKLEKAGLILPTPWPRVWEAEAETLPVDLEAEFDASLSQLLAGHDLTLVTVQNISGVSPQILPNVAGQPFTMKMI